MRYLPIKKISFTVLKVKLENFQTQFLIFQKITKRVCFSLWCSSKKAYHNSSLIDWLEGFLIFSVLRIFLICSSFLYYFWKLVWCEFFRRRYNCIHWFFLAIWTFWMRSIYQQPNNTTLISSISDPRQINTRHDKP